MSRKRSKLKAHGILTGAAFNLKKVNRKIRILTTPLEKGMPLLSNGLPNFNARCGQNNPNTPENIRGYKNQVGAKLILGLVGKLNERITQATA